MSVFLYCFAFVSQSRPFFISTVTGPDGRSKGSARVTFLSQEDATKVVERALEEPISIFDRTTRVEYSFSPTPRNARPEPNERLFLVNWPGSESELKDAFGRFSRSITDIYFRAYFLWHFLYLPTLFYFVTECWLLQPKSTRLERGTEMFS